MYWYNLIFFCVLVLSNTAQAQNTINDAIQGDEQTIRNLVKRQDQNPGERIIPRTDESIFVSGAYPRPVLGNQQSAENKQINEQLKKERLNFATDTRIERLVISQAKDMAYEFGYSNLSWDTPEKKHISFEASYLRVWRKMNNEWKADAAFFRPNETADLPKN